MNAISENLSIRWAGILLMLGCLIMPVAVLIYIFVYASPTGTGEAGAITNADLAIHFLIKREFASNVWRTEVFSVVFTAVASFVLINSETRESKFISAKIGWLFVALGSIVLIGMYAVMLGSYRIAAENFANEPALFPAMNNIAVVIFNFGNFLTFIGFGIVFLSEQTSEFIPKLLAKITAILSFIFAAFSFLFFCEIANYKQFLFLGPVVVFIYLIAAFLGFSIWRKNY